MPPVSSGLPASRGPHPSPGSGIVLGLVGGIASGKSTVARIFLELRPGVHIDADAVAHEVLDEPEVAAALRARFPAAADPDGRMNRTRLARHVFDRPEELAALEELTHPRIRERIRRKIAAARGRWVVLDAALLLETGADALCDVVVHVACPARTRRRRAVRTRGWTAAEHAAREARQWSMARKRARARYVVDNSGTEADTRESVRRVLAAIEGRAGSAEES